MSSHSLLLPNAPWINRMVSVPVGLRDWKKSSGSAAGSESVEEAMPLGNYSYYLRTPCQGDVIYDGAS